MRFEDWLHTVIENGTICEKELNNLSTAYSKKQIMDIVLHPNGLHYICEIGELGYRLPYETILKDFSPYINGNYQKVNIGDNNVEYTTELYCCYSDSDTITIDSTMVSLLGCCSKVHIQENHCVSLFVDTNCDLEIYCPLSARCRVYTFGEAKIETFGNPKIRIKKEK